MGSFNDGPEAQAKIAEEIRQAMHEQGFFTLINHGFTQEEVARQMDIGYVSEGSPWVPAACAGAERALNAGR
jgi:hypothetical protein